MNQPNRFRPTPAGAILACSRLVRRVFPILAFSLALGAPAVETTAPPKAADLTELPLEALMNIEVPTVFGASKLEQKVTEAPSSVTIVTADEVKKDRKSTRLNSSHL